MAKDNKGRINIQIDRDVGSGEYANFVVITHSNAEFVMDFTRCCPAWTRPESIQGLSWHLPTPRRS